MARVRLRLFAAARDAAGRTEVVLEAATLGEVLEIARTDFGTEFAAVLASARVWVNGEEPADGEGSSLADGDEIAVVPPVSGGAR